jgi:hypothetical protein
MYHWSGMPYNLYCISLRMLITKSPGASLVHLYANTGTRNIISVTINEGGAYDNVSNSVIVPVTGVYYLMLTVNAPFASPSRHRIMLNANTAVLEDNRRQSTMELILPTIVLQTSLIMFSLATNDVLTYHFSELSTNAVYSD